MNGAKKLPEPSMTKDARRELNHGADGNTGIVVIFKERW